MESQSCKRCSATWNAQNKVEVCPFCGNKLNEQTFEITSIVDGIKWAISEHGISILSESKKLISILTDIVPVQNQDDLRLLKKAIANSAVVANIKKMPGCDKQEKILLRDKSIGILVREEYLAERFALHIMGVLLEAIEITIPKDSDCLNETVDDFGSSDAKSIEQEQFEQSSSKYSNLRIVPFGRYPQNSDEKYGENEIEWIILKERNDDALLLSRYALDAQAFHDNISSTTSNWPKSTIRHWLNNDFFITAFSEEDRMKVLSTRIDVGENKYVEDKVFLLSDSEARNCFNDNLARKCEPSCYAISRGASLDDGNCWWWLRTKASGKNYVMIVSYDGIVDQRGEYVHRSMGAIRPAIWIRKTAFAAHENNTLNDKSPKHKMGIDSRGKYIYYGDVDNKGTPCGYGEIA